MASRVSRRRFLAGSAAAGVGLAASWPLFADDRPMPHRELGRTGLSVSLAGLGCHPLGGSGLDDAQAGAIVRRAIELGVNYFDTAPSYGNGASERRLGKALEGVRDKVILATKTLQRDRRGALRELDASLERLRTDRIDLWQFHALARTGDTDRLLEKGGALEAAWEAKKAGKVRFYGITGHADPRVFVDALKRHPFDALLIPLNCIDPHHLSFETTALPFARERRTGVIAMKVFCSGRLPGQRIVGGEECLRYTYGLPIAVCIVGCSSIAEVELAAHVARNLRVLSEEERAALHEATRPHSPALEWYKAKS